MKKLILSLFFLVQIICANAKDHEGIVTENLNSGGFTLISQSKPVGVIVAENDKKGVLIAVQNLQKDFERVCGKQAQLFNSPTSDTKQCIIVGSLESPYVKQLIKAKQLDDPVLSEIRDEIKGLDVNNMTPVEALNKLAEIKKICGLN